jgi:cytochrome c556
MKTIIPFFLAAAFALAAFSCSQSSKDKETTADDVAEKAGELAGAAKDYAAGEMADFEREFNAFQQNANDEIAKMKEKSAELAGDAKRAYQSELAKIEEQSRALDAKMKELKNAAGDKKEALKTEVKDLRTALEKSIETFKKERSK